MQVQHDFQLVDRCKQIFNGLFVVRGVTLYSVGEGFEHSELARGAFSGTAEGFAIGGELYPFREMSLPEILSGGRRMEFTCGRQSYLIEKENACLNKFVELYKWAKSRDK